MSEPTEKKAEPTSEERSPRSIEDRPDPTDTAGEFVNAVDLAAKLISGEVRGRDVAQTLLERVFGKSEPKKEEAKAPLTSKLTAITGGAGK